MNMTFSSLALCSPSSVVICLLRSEQGGWNINRKAEDADNNKEGGEREREKEKLNFRLVRGKKERLVFL